MVEGRVFLGQHAQPAGVLRRELAHVEEVVAVAQEAPRVVVVGKRVAPHALKVFALVDAPGLPHLSQHGDGVGDELDALGVIALGCLKHAGAV